MLFNISVKNRLSIEKPFPIGLRKCKIRNSIQFMS